MGDHASHRRRALGALPHDAVDTEAVQDCRGTGVAFGGLNNLEHRARIVRPAVSGAAPARLHGRGLEICGLRGDRGAWEPHGGRSDAIWVAQIGFDLSAAPFLLDSSSPSGNSLLVSFLVALIARKQRPKVGDLEETAALRFLSINE